MARRANPVDVLDDLGRSYDSDALACMQLADVLADDLETVISRAADLERALRDFLRSPAADHAACEAIPRPAADSCCC